MLKLTANELQRIKEAKTTSSKYDWRCLGSFIGKVDIAQTSIHADNKIISYVAARNSSGDFNPYMFQCQNCTGTFVMESCTKCGGDSMVGFDLDKVGNMAIKCNSCAKATTSWECPQCHNHNSYSDSLFWLKNTGWCFIATAACGSEHANEVIILSQFRDILTKNDLGRRFVKRYYKISPPIASIISNNKMLRAFTLYLFVVPLSRIARHLTAMFKNR